MPDNKTSNDTLVRVEHLTKYFPVRPASCRIVDGQAVDDVSFSIRRARRSAWSVNPAAARRPSGAPCCG
jgi:hypothetical protein